MTIVLTYLGDAPDFLSKSYLSSSDFETEAFEPFGLLVRNLETGFETRYFATEVGDVVPVERVTYSDGSTVLATLEADPSVSFEELVTSMYAYLLDDPTALQAILSRDVVYDGARAQGQVLMDYFLWAGIDGSAVVYGSDFDDLLVGTRGDDLIRPGGGSDSILATEGNDTIDFGSDEASGVGRSEEVILGYDDFDPLAPGAGVEFLVDLAASGGTVVTPRGTDVLVNLRDAASADGAGLRLSGTSGADRFEIDGADDTRVEIAAGGGDDVISLSPSSPEQAVRLTYGVTSLGSPVAGIVADFAAGVVEQDGFDGRDRVEIPADAPDFLFEVMGTAFADRIVGRDADDVVFLQGGDDTLDGGAGTDRVVYDDGSITSGVVVDLSRGVATGSTESGTFEALLTRVEDVQGTGFGDALIGDAGANRLMGGDGQDTLEGGAGSDTLEGGAGSDLLDGGAGADAFSGGGGADTFVFDNRGDVIVDPEDTFDDLIVSTVKLDLAKLDFAGEVRLEGTGNLRVDGDGSIDSRVVGNAGRNILVERGGADTLTGGEGNDVFAFVFEERSSARIEDFSDGDRLALDDQLFGLGNTGINVRKVTGEQVKAALRDGLASYDRKTGELRHDPDGRDGDAESRLVVTIDGTSFLTSEALLLF